MVCRSKCFMFMRDDSHQKNMETLYTECIIKEKNEHGWIGVLKVVSS